MKFLIVGVGALGSVYLAFLTKAGHEVAGLLKKGRTIKKVKVEGIWGEFEQEVEALDSLEKLSFQPEVVLLTVKSYDTERALRDIKPIMRGKTYLMIAQNGYGNYERAVERYGRERVILSRVIFGAKLLEWGRVRITVCGDDVVIGDPEDVIKENFLRGLAKLFTDAGIPTRYEKEVYKYLWDKILYNCALNPLGALFEKTYGELYKNPHVKSLMDRIIEEAFEVIKAYGIPTFWSSSEDYRRHFYNNLIPPTAEHYPSMLEDVKKGRTEIDALNGALLELARKKELKLPVNSLIVELIKAKELFNQP
ncbi:MAG: 2-dehydropantoate 2-reductase [Acidobacteria bacterium]|nr:MAG: 2-dehydropantoate 2-reductase [Acidobacteriota bacterium]